MQGPLVNLEPQSMFSWIRVIHRMTGWQLESKHLLSIWDVITGNAKRVLALQELIVNEKGL